MQTRSGVRSALAAQGGDGKQMALAPEKENRKRQFDGDSLSHKQPRNALAPVQAKVCGKRRKWVTWRDVAGNLVMAEKEQNPPSSGAAAAESESDGDWDDVSITGL